MDLDAVTDPAAGDDLAEPAVALVAEWLGRTERDRRRREVRLNRRLLGIIDDPDGVAFTMAFVDRVARHRDDATAAAELAAIVVERRLPHFLSRVDRLLLRAGARLAPRAPSLVMPLARRRMRQLVGHLVVDADPRAVHAHIRSRRAEHFDLNMNLLGELVLGEEEAQRRLRQTVALTQDSEVEYVSVKISSVASQLDLWSFEVTLARIEDRLRTLLRAAATMNPPCFVNLDMEEYRDLELTVRAFTALLDEDEFHELQAGIVLQAYLPEAFGALKRITEWAQLRRGAPIRIRLVKGANLAMERVEAALHGWEQAPFATKDDVDANYKRCLDWVMTPERLAGAHLGVASHNLFDVAWAYLLADRRGVADQVQIEMLHGIAPAHARTVRATSGALRLYTPIVARRDFDIAIGYLFRRLEENAADENFLRHLFTLRTGSAGFEREAERFRRAVARRWEIDVTTRRGRAAPPTEGFRNEPDSDPTQPGVQALIAAARALRPSPPVTPLTNDLAAIDRIVEAARVAQREWWSCAPEDRRRILDRVAGELTDRRTELLATMADEGRKTHPEADAEVNEAIDFARWYAEGSRDLVTLQDSEHATFIPLGVVVVAPPWNFPVAIPAGGVLAALAAGNAVVFKPAQETPRCAEIVAEACWAAGVPRDLLHFVRTADGDAGRRLVTAADGVILTGSIETATLFRSWKPEMRLFAETSGKNAVVVTERADIDLAVGDVVHSAFGHSGQKCSAASLAILVGSMYDDERFRAKLVDATRSLHVGWPCEPGVTFGPLIVPAGGKLLDALTALGPGERWLLEPRRLNDAGALWSPGVKDGVAEGSSFHRTECFGPVLGLMRAPDLTEALRLQNGVAFGLTGGIHSLDPAEVDRWLGHVEVGNAYVNRHITGAIVRRQPFGGWKASSVGPGAKAGGPDYLMQLGHWADATEAPDPERWLAQAAASDAHWWAQHYGVSHDPTRLFCEANVLRYRPRPGVCIRAGGDARPEQLARAMAAAARAGSRPEISVASEELAPESEAVRVEDDAAFVVALAGTRSVSRVRLVGTAPAGVHRAAAGAGVDVIDDPVTASGRLEMRWYLREQAVSITLHRFGTVADDAVPHDLRRGQRTAPVVGW